MVTFEWSWFSFIVGAVGTFTLLFWVVLAIAVRQYRKQRKQASSFEDQFNKWANSSSSE